MDKKTYLICVILSLTTYIFSQQYQLLDNGGFERSLANWETEINNAAEATFNIITTNSPHSGRNMLEVNVTKRVSATNSVKLIYDSISTDTEKIYMVRFWAKSAQANSRMFITFIGENTNTKCEFRIDDAFGSWKNGWQMYQYLFTSKDDYIKMDISFNTIGIYYLDDFEIIDDTHPVLDLKTQLMWQNNLTGYGWASGDNDVSVVLPDGRVAWIFSDSFLGWPNPNEYYLREGTMINNLIVVEDLDGKLTTLYAGTQSSPKTLVTSSKGIYWVGDGIIENNKLIVMYNEWGGLDYNNSAGVATFSLPNLTLEKKIVSAYKGSDIPNALLQEDDYTYIYTEMRSGFARYTRVARVPAGQLNNPDIQWEFYTKTNTWDTDLSQAKQIVTAPGCSVRKLGEGNYVMSGVPNLSSDFCVWFSQTPYGPWGNKTVLYKIPSEEGVLFYLGHIHNRPESETTGVYTLSYSLYPFGGTVPQQRADKGTYLPIYMKANLRELSPYTPPSSVNQRRTESTIRIFPNPSFDILNIEGVKEVTNIQILNLTGQIVTETKARTVDISALEYGTYIARVTHSKGIDNRMFIKN